jgi:hypothetical protein
MLVIAPAREAGCGRRTPIARSQSSRITKTEARYLPEHATMVDAEQRACLAVSSQGAPDSSPVAENVAKHAAARASLDPFRAIRALLGLAKVGNPLGVDVDRCRLDLVPLPGKLG